MKNKTRLSSGEIYRKYGIVLIMIFLFIASAVINHNFLKPQNLINILKQISVVTIIACGETMLIVSGMIDLSAGFCVQPQRVFRRGSLQEREICRWRYWRGSQSDVFAAG